MRVMGAFAMEFDGGMAWRKGMVFHPLPKGTIETVINEFIHMPG